MVEKDNIKIPYIKKTFDINKDLFYQFKMLVAQKRTTQKKEINKILGEYLAQEK